MLQNAYLLAKIGADIAENERNFAAILPKTGNDLDLTGGAGEATVERVLAEGIAAAQRFPDLLLVYLTCARGARKL